MAVSIFPKFELKTCLGAGAFGIVFEVFDTESESRSAMKFIFLDSDDPGTNKSVERECSVSQSVKPHHNLVQTIQVLKMSFTSEDLKTKLIPLFTSESLHRFLDLYLGRVQRLGSIPTVSLQMPLCGETLRQWLNLDHSLFKDINNQKIQIVGGMISGLRHLHNHKILHRDLKPENIMFSSNGYTYPIKIGDFGLSRLLHSDESKTGGALTSRTGTPDYMAPEMNGNEYTFQSDLFSLGLIIWEVVQSIRAPDRKRMFDRLVNDQDDLLVKPVTYLPKIQAAIVKLTKRKRKDRMLNLDSLFFVELMKFVQIEAIAYKEVSGLMNLTNFETIKITVAGDVEVGKRSLLATYSTNKYPSTRFDSGSSTDYLYYIEDMTTIISIDGKPSRLSLLVTRCQENKSFMQDLSESKADVILLCFGIDNLASFRSIKKSWLPSMIPSHQMPPVFLVGLKKDLRNNEDTIRSLGKINQATVSYDEGLSKARELGVAKYVECSSKRMEGVNEVMNEAIRAAITFVNSKPKGEMDNTDFIPRATLSAPMQY